MSFIKYECQILKWARFGIIVDLDCYLHQSSCFLLFFLKVGPLGLSCQAVIAFPVLDKGLLIPI